MGAQLPNLAVIVEMAPKTDRQVAASFLTDRNRELQRVARNRQDIQQKEPQLRQPDQLLIARVAEDQQNEYKARTEHEQRGQPNSKYKDQMKQGKYGSSWRPGGRSRYFKRQDSGRSRDYGNGRRKRRQEGDDGSKDDRRSPKRRSKEECPRSKRQKRGGDRETK